MGIPASGTVREQRTLRRLLLLPGYGRLVGAFALNELAWFFGTVALSLLVYRRTGSILGSAAFFLCSQAVPALVAPLIVGRLDRLSPRRVLPILHWLEAVLFVVLAWMATRFTLGPVLALVVVDGAIALVARALAGGARTEVLKPAGLVREGAALSSVLFSGAYLLGPALAGIVTAFGGTRAALLVSAGMFAAIGGLLLSRSIPAAIVHEGPGERRLRAALRQLRGDRAVTALFSIQVIALVCFTIPTPIEVVYTVHTMHAGSAGYGVFLSVWGGAAVLGSLLYARWRRLETRLLLGCSLALAGAGFAVMAFAPDLGIAFAGAALGGLSNGLGMVAFGVELQERVPQSWIALALSLNQGISQLAPGVGIAVGGGLAVLVSVRFAFGVAGAACVGCAALTTVLLAPVRLTALASRAPEDAAVPPPRSAAAERRQATVRETGAPPDPRAESLA